MIRWFILFLTLSLGITAAAAAQPLTYGADASSGAPYIFADPKDPTKFAGYEVDIMEALGRQLNRPVKFVQNDWSNLIPGLNVGLYDVAICGLEITPEHSAEVDFTRPYYVTDLRISVRKDSPALDGLDALKGKKVGTLKSSQAERVMAAAGGIDIKTYDQQLNAYQDLKNSRLDAVLMDGPIAAYYAGPDPALKETGGPVGHIEYGIAVAKGRNPALLADLNRAIGAIEANGELRIILDRWKLWNPAMAAVLRDDRPAQAQPTAYDAYVAGTKIGDWADRFKRYLGLLPQLGWAAVTTLQISLLSMALAITLGALLALARVYGGRLLDGAATIYIETVRGTPLLIQILFVFYGLPNIGVKLDPFIAGVLALGLNYAAYEAENYRAGLLSVPRGQTEAALALNMTHAQAIRHVIGPQAFRIVLPPTTNDFISLLKDSSLVSVITMVELTQTYIQISTTYYDYFGTGLIVGAIYLLIGLPFVRLARWTERRLSVGYGRRAQR